VHGVLAAIKADFGCLLVAALFVIIMAAAWLALISNRTEWRFDFQKLYGGAARISEDGRPPPTTSNCPASTEAMVDTRATANLPASFKRGRLGWRPFSFY